VSCHLNKEAEVFRNITAGARRKAGTTSGEAFLLCYQFFIFKLRPQLNFFNRLKLLLPVQSHLKKYSAFLSPQITGLSRGIPRPQEGRFAIVTNVGYGMRWTQMRF
jgi:hypothetical protein